MLPTTTRARSADLVSTAGDQTLDDGTRALIASRDRVAGSVGRGHDLRDHGESPIPALDGSYLGTTRACLTLVVDNGLVALLTCIEPMLTQCSCTFSIAHFQPPPTP